MANITGSISAVSTTPVYDIPSLTKPIILKIFFDLNPREVATCSFICRQWQVCAKSEILWQFFFEKVCPGRGDRLKPPSFKDAFIRFYTNIRKGVYSAHKLQSEDDNEPSFVLSERGFLYILNRDYQISEICVRNFPGETIKKKFKIYSGGFDDWVYCITIHQGILYVGFMKGTIQAWDLEKEKCKGIFAGHQEEKGRDCAIGELVVIGQRLRSCCYGGTIKIWNVITYECIETIATSSKVNRSYAVAVDGETLYTGFKDGTIVAKNLTTKKEKSFMGYEAPEGLSRMHELGETRIRSLASTGGILYANSTYAGISIWDFMASTDAFSASTRPLAIHRDGDRTIWTDYDSGSIENVTSTGGIMYVLFLDHSVSSKNKIIARDFLASDEIIFQELAKEFKWRNSPDKWKDRTIARFHRMPDSAKESVYKELYDLIKEEDQSSGGYDSNRDFCVRTFDEASSQQKAQAIENYLATLNKEF